ncbi:Demethylmenaquinone methyltransferase [Pleurostoma richardsiae]|uniref:Demethylmenaquinone methyltransferase n=1 Tax=Pleurostoma richardsiae TaxID=41990 RepID=A0AA38RKT8_9PEZI|nr:Demethylmenaquinone methyltransferase [Pleurostoma richardsiae]
MAKQFGTETQVESAKRMYDARAANYEDSWHPDYSRRFIELVPLVPGQRVLDLCCGTGLEAFLAAEIVGDAGEVIGVDVSEGMLSVLRGRQQRQPELGRRIRTLLHDVTNLQGLKELEKGSFDVVLCSSAFVLFDDPARVVAHWREYLRPGGIAAIDITHELNLRSGMILERVADRMGVTFPSNRTWVKSADSFCEILEREGFTVENVVLLDKITGERSTYYRVDQADEQFNYIINTALTKNVATDDFKEKARPIFREEWEKEAVDGKVEIVDALYVYIARRKE